MITFWIAGKPRSTQTGSVVSVNGRSFPVRRNTSWSTVCGLVARQHAPERPWSGPVFVSLVFRLPRPQAKRRGRGARELVVTTRPDIENLTKGLLDSWNGVLWEDDAQVCRLHVAKEYEVPLGQGVGVLVSAEELPR